MFKSSYLTLASFLAIFLIIGSFGMVISSNFSVDDGYQKGSHFERRSYEMTNQYNPSVEKQVGIQDSTLTDQIPKASNHDSSDNTNENDKTQSNLANFQSAIELSVHLNSTSPISIDGNSDFANQASAEGWNGSGTELDPYIIGNLLIETSNFNQDAISVQNTDVFFIIENCQLVATGSNGDGIYLNSVSNGQLVNNTVYNSTRGFFLQNQNTNNKLINNTAYNNTNIGFYFGSSSNYNILENNTSIDNNHAGFYFNDNTNNSITGNSAIENNQNGFYLYSADNQTISGNYAFNNTNSGIRLYRSNNNTLIDNIGTYDGFAGIFLDESKDNHIFNNTATDNNIYGIYLLTGSNTNTIDSNTVLSNSNDGILVELSSFNNVRNNHAEDNYHGLVLQDSSNNLVNNNSAILNNYVGMNIYGSSRYNTISNNTVVNNDLSGVQLGSGQENTISRNIIQNNGLHGVYLLNARSNTIANNTIFNNTEYGISLFDSGAYNNSVMYNDFFTNSGGISSHHQAEDNVNSNTFSYNYWSDHLAYDYNGDGVRDSSYSIDGSANNYDYYSVVKAYYPINPSIPRSFNAGYSSNRTSLYWTIPEITGGYDIIYHIFRSQSSGGPYSYIGNTTARTYQDYNVSDGLTYYYVAKAQNSAGTSDYSREEFVTVDKVAPTADPQPDITYEYGTTGHELTWEPYDLNPYLYNIFLNNTIFEAGYWSNYISISVDGLLPGLHNFTMRIIDDENNAYNDNVIVIVEDTTIPEINPLNNITMEQGATNEVIQWSVFDSFPRDYTIYLNQSIVGFGNWFNSVNYTLDGLQSSNYNLTLVVYDIYGNSNINTVFVNVADTTSPSIDNPSDIAYQVGLVGNNISWNMSDLNPGLYQVLVNNTILEDGSWISEDNTTINVDGYAEGWYNFTLVAYDYYGNQAVDTVMVHVVSDTLIPMILSNPSGLSYEHNSTGNEIIWIVSDANPSVYQIYFNGTLNQTGTWVSAQSIVISVDDLEVGVHNVTIQFNDLAGNQIQDMILVIVEDTIPPQISQPEDIIYEHGTIGQNITWSAIDSSPTRYQIHLNYSLVEDASWIMYEITLNVDNLSVGSHNFTLIVNDSGGNTIRSSVMVIVVDTTAPQVSNEDGYIVEYGAGMYNITWQISDTNSYTYHIYVNDTIVDFGYNNEEVSFAFYVYDYDVGRFEIDIEVTDNFGNTGSDQAVMVVGDTTPPSLQSPANQTYVEGTTGHYLRWNVSEYNPGVYEIYRDNELINSASWTTDVVKNSIVINIDYLSEGVYVYSIVLTDLYGNSISDEVRVSVTPSTDSPSVTKPGETTVVITVTQTYDSSDISSIISEESEGGFLSLHVGWFLLSLVSVITWRFNYHRKQHQS